MVMGKIQEFSISFDGNQEVFSPGNSVNGYLAVTLKKPMEMREIRLRFVGKSHVHWRETRGSGNNRHTKHYRADEEYFDVALTVYGKGVNGYTHDRITLPSGAHRLPFSFLLPNNLPSSFEGGTGYVRYFVKATIDKPWKFDHTCKRAFTVLDVLDLNLEASARNMGGASAHKHVCCCCCRSGPIEAEIFTDRTGYVSGDSIDINVNVENNSKRNVEYTTVGIYQVTQFITQSKIKMAKKVVARKNGPGCFKGQSLSWTNESLRIPALPPSEMRNCGIINVTYFMEFEVHLPSCSGNLTARIPIIIGTIPLRGIIDFNTLAQSQPNLSYIHLSPPPPYEQNNINYSYENSVQAPPYICTQRPLPIFEQTADSPPPSYMASVGAREVDIRDEGDSSEIMGNVTYTPQYTYYEWNRSAVI